MKRSIYRELCQRHMGLAGAVLCLAVLAGSAHALPWSYDFETNSVGDPLTNLVSITASYTNTWSASTNTCVVTNDAFADPPSTNSAYVPTAENLTGTLTGLTASDDKIWMDMYVKPTLMEYSANVAVESSASAMFYFTSEGYPVVQDGSSTNWVVVSNNISSGSVEPVTNNAAWPWVRVTICRNYTASEWALFLNGKLTRDNIQFISSRSTHTRMRVKNETRLDDIWIDSVRPTNSAPSGFTPLTSDVDTDGMEDSWEIDYFDDIDELGGDDYDGDGYSNVEEYTLGTDPTNPGDPPDWPVALPYREGFETATNGMVISSGGWHGLTNSGTATVQNSDVIEGSQALSLTNGSLSLIVNTPATNVWVQVYTKPVFYDDGGGSSQPAGPSGGQVAAFYINTNGEFVAYDGGAGWTTQNVGQVSSVAADTWLGIATHLDYAVDNWDLYVSTNAAFGAAMRKVNTDPMDFAVGASGFSNMTIQAEETTYLDVIAASIGYVANSTNNTNMIAYDRMAGQSQTAVMPPYDYAGSNATLAYDLGDDMTRELLDGDKLSIYATNGWNTYALNSGSWIKDTPSSLDVTNLTVFRAMAMTLQRGAGTNAVAFYPYGPEPSLGSIDIIGASDPIVLGWNEIASPWDVPRDMSTWNFAGAVTGDRIYIGSDRLIYNGTTWTRWGETATNVWQIGESVWYYHKGAGYTWNPM